MKNLIKRTALAALLVTTCTLTATAFDDVTPKDWYYQDVTQMAEQGVINGHPDGTYRPQDPVTNAEYATMIAKGLLGNALKAETSGQGMLQALVSQKGATPQEVEQWWAPYVSAVGMSQGWRGTTAMNTMFFSLDDLELQAFVKLSDWQQLATVVNEPMSRYDLIMAIDSLYRYSGLVPTPDANLETPGFLEALHTQCQDKYTDWPTEDGYGKDAIARLDYLGILKGNANGTLNLSGTVTRAEMATMLTRLWGDDTLAKTSYTTVEQPGAYDMATYTVPADFNKDGILTETEVDQMLTQLRERYPHQSDLGDAIFPSAGYLPVGTPGWAFDSPDGIYYHSKILGAGGDCIAWAYFVSDSIFGDLPYRTIDRNQWELADLRKGDVFFREGSHVNIITDTCVGQDYSTIETTNSGASHEIDWEDGGTNQISYQGIWDVRTRYPQ